MQQTNNYYIKASVGTRAKERPYSHRVNISCNRLQWRPVYTLPFSLQLSL